jgi:WD40 repeat protein
MYLIGARRDGIDLWDYPSKQHLVTLQSHYPTAFSTSSDGTRLAVVPNYFQPAVIWDISDVNNITEVCHLAPLEGDCIQAIHFINTSEHVIVGHNHSLALYDATTGILVKLIRGRNSVVFAHVFHDRILTLSSDGFMKEWDHNLTELLPQQEQQQPERVLGYNIGCACISPSEDIIAFAAAEDSIGLLNPVTLRVTKFLDIVDDIDYLQFHMDGSRVLAGWRGMHYSVIDLVSEAMLFDLRCSGGVCFSFDCASLYGSSADGTILCWDAESGTPIDCPFTAAAAILSHGKHTALSVCSPPTAILM